MRIYEYWRRFNLVILNYIFFNIIVFYIKTFAQQLDTNRLEKMIDKISRLWWQLIDWFNAQTHRFLIGISMLKPWNQSLNRAVTNFFTSFLPYKIWKILYLWVQKIMYFIISDLLNNKKNHQNRFKPFCMRFVC